MVNTINRTIIIDLIPFASEVNNTLFATINRNDPRSAELIEHLDSILIGNLVPQVIKFIMYQLTSIILYPIILQRVITPHDEAIVNDYSNVREYLRVLLTDLLPHDDSTHSLIVMLVDLENLIAILELKTIAYICQYAPLIDSKYIIVNRFTFEDLNLLINIDLLPDELYGIGTMGL
jgi:hypothetical protein